MSTSTPNSSNPSRIATPNPGQSRFTAQAATAEDLLQSQTVGLVRLDDFRKRRADALEQKELGRFTNARSDPAAATPANVSDGGSTPKELPKKKKRKTVAKGKLSFGVENEEEEEEDTASTPRSAAATPKESTPTETLSRTASPATVTQRHDGGEKKRLGPNSKLAVAPKAMTKSALLREAQAREQLRKEFLSMQEAVKNTEFIIPFVFYDGTNIPGGSCKVKKGDHTWVFLDRSRKAGADLGVGGSEKANSRREWARVGVDDLMLVRGEVIIPHHYEFYYFIVNRTLGPSSIPLFNYSASVIPSSRSQSSSPEPPEAYNPLEAGPRPSKRANNSIPSPQDLLRLEGATDDPNFTKVVDRRWYERNKHIFPASVWEEFDPGKDYSKGRRRDMEGNAFFFG
ncbi:MAG: hypothetical protein HETSPECPRED_003061 [Heterodermia speciosa]|uniref:FAM50A/XAP5 C-terminal domain-containing protein n=1 Tax=Heterodermia speciosa TaxID=116794 RepID=A0A8H3IIM3_9LECA|nr:MAG: hypothetical protein HETSPECPRED_003061 [Heterodermia speciosa]